MVPSSLVGITYRLFEHFRYVMIWITISSSGSSWPTKTGGETAAEKSLKYSHVQIVSVMFITYRLTEADFTSHHRMSSSWHVFVNSMISCILISVTPDSWLMKCSFVIGHPNINSQSASIRTHECSQMLDCFFCCVTWYFPIIKPIRAVCTSKFCIMWHFSITNIFVRVDDRTIFGLR